MNTQVLLDASPPLSLKFPNVYLRRRGATRILYAPLKGLVLEVTEEAASLIEALKQGPVEGRQGNVEEWTALLSSLDDVGIAKSDSDHSALSHREKFRPTHVTLSLTTGCNLRCVYCYARAGEKSRTMPFSLARAAIEFVATNAIRQNAPSFGITFHGEGEPTYEWQLFRQVVEYAETVAHQLALGVTFAMTTNALWGRAQRAFIVDRFSDLSISLDGLPEVQAAQRPTISGKDAFKTILANLIEVGEKGVPCGIRSTIMPNSVDRMVPFLEFIAANTKITNVRLEPIFDSGRGADLPIDNSSFDLRFAERFTEAQARGRELGLSVSYSGCSDINHSGNFCGATGSNLNFTVMSHGVVSSCYEINEPTHELGEFFIYGKFDEQTQTFEFLPDRMDRLMNFSTKTNSPCASCFAQWNCRGDCLSRYSKKKLLGGGASPRCSLNQALADARLVNSLESQSFGSGDAS
ncbi:radical SAM protein [Caballeronia sp. NK8]|uniref:radical SAM protein n=1 Tax=Caballeronia sp. NK8 TaxID=140098 RepID=UPI001BCA7AD0|nr:radical SAM protein [Caballeronia sp. NK8]